MRPIIAGILSITQYINELNNNIEQFHPPECPQCGNLTLWHHGSYERQADFENAAKNSLNPVTILRFYCPNCRSTCSILPECIPPRRHYPWLIQQMVFLLLLGGSTAYKASDAVRPSYRTIKRWLSRACDKFLEQSDYLRSLLPELGQQVLFNDFWRALLDKIPLSKAMISCHFSGLVIP